LRVKGGWQQRRDDTDDDGTEITAPMMATTLTMLMSICLSMRQVIAMMVTRPPERIEV
jgi:hypothetical protein